MDSFDEDDLVDNLQWWVSVVHVTDGQKERVQVHQFENFSPKHTRDYAYGTKYVLRSSKWEGALKRYRVYITRVEGAPGGSGSNVFYSFLFLVTENNLKHSLQSKREMFPPIPVAPNNSDFLGSETENEEDKGRKTSAEISKIRKRNTEEELQELVAAVKKNRKTKGPGTDNNDKLPQCLPLNPNTLPQPLLQNSHSSPKPSPSPTSKILKRPGTKIQRNDTFQTTHLQKHPNPVTSMSHSEQQSTLQMTHQEDLQCDLPSSRVDVQRMIDDQAKEIALLKAALQEEQKTKADFNSLLERLKAMETVMSSQGEAIQSINQILSECDEVTFSTYKVNNWFSGLSKHVGGGGV